MKKVKDSPDQNVIEEIATAEEKTGSDPSDETTEDTTPEEEKTPVDGHFGAEELPEETVPTVIEETPTEEIVPEEEVAEAPAESEILETPPTDEVTESVEEVIAEELPVEETPVEEEVVEYVAPIGCEHEFRTKVSTTGKAELTESKCIKCGFETSSIFDKE